MFEKQHSKPQNRIDTLIGADATINGDIHFSGGLRVDGVVNGNIISEPDKPSTLVLSEQAQVNGEIRVTHLVINGAVNGPVCASEYMELQGKANITGDVKYKTMEIHLGATISGKLAHMAGDTVNENVVSLKSGSTE